MMIVRRATEQLGERVTDRMVQVGRITLFCVLVLRYLGRDLWRARRWRLVFTQMYEVGTRSVPVVMLTGMFIGMVLTVELFPQFKQFGMTSNLGGVIAITVVSHLGPVLAAVMLAGRVGGAFTAEIGTMNVTEQLDALRVMGSEPVSYLVVPRLLACLLMIPITTVFGDLLGVIGAWLIALQSGVTNEDFWSGTARLVQEWDLYTGLAKSLFFGVVIALVGCYYGFHCRPGAQGVGRATTDAFVTSFVAIIIMNFFLAKIGRTLYDAWY